MPWTNYPFNKYEIEIYSGLEDGAYPAPQAKIDCIDSTDKIVGRLYFHKEGTQLPKNEWDYVKGYPRIYLHLGQFLNVLSVLRKHKPTYVQFENDLKQASLCTLAEFTGQEEIPI
jgi:hypothetical protein